MPSLKQLKQLQDLFAEIGHENETLDVEGRRADTYDLPENEPEQRPEPPAETVQPEAPEVPEAPEAAETDTAGLDGDDESETSVLDDIFNNLSDLITSSPSDEDTPVPPPAAGDSTAGESPAEDLAGMDMSDLDNFGDMDFPAPPASGAERQTGEDAPGLDDDMDLEKLLQGFGDEDSGEEGVATPAASGAPDIADTPDIAGAPDIAGGAASVSDISDEEKASLFPDIPLEELKEPEEAEPKATPVEAAPPPPETQPLPAIDDFLSPIDDKDKPPPADEKSEKPPDAISLTEKQLSQLLDTIASYPLNLRIACEKIIAEETVEPALLSQFIKLLVQGRNAREASILAGKILKTKIALPKSYKTGEELEAEQSSFVYIFIHKFFPVIRLFMLIAALAASVVYLSYQFIYKPVRATLTYRQGYELIGKGEYTQGNRRFDEALKIFRIKNWFYRYAERLRDEHQYLYAENKYEELLLNYPRDKKGTLDYAAMESDYLHNYEKADRLIRSNILDYEVDDREGLLALGDINLAWGEYDPSRYEEARLAYAKLMAAYGQTDPIMERMMLYLIRTDKLGEVIPIQNYFMKRPKSKISTPALAELGGYLLDKHTEVTKGVPDEHIEEIEGIQDVLLRAVRQDFSLPEAHYHLARYYNNYNATQEERQTLEIAADAFDKARPESSKRSRYRVDTQLRLAKLMIAGREFIKAEETLAKGIAIMEDAVERRVVRRAPEFGELYAYLGDLAYFAKSGDMREALDFYLSAEENGWSPPEMQYRLGSAYYRLGEYAPAVNRLFNVSMERPYNRRLLNALGNASYMRSDYLAAEGYFKRLINMLENDRNRFPMLLPNDRPEHRELLERMMTAHNNLGVTYNALAASTGRPEYRAAALGEFAESAREWDALERHPETFIRPGITESTVPSASLPYLNIQNTLYPEQGGNGLIFMQIDKDLSDNSWWEAVMRSEGLP
jgi:tetratricopeptide (TPR) repeat protein